MPQDSARESAGVHVRVGIECHINAVGSCILHEPQQGTELAVALPSAGVVRDMDRHSRSSPDVECLKVGIDEAITRFVTNVSDAHTSHVADNPAERGDRQ